MIYVIMIGGIAVALNAYVLIMKYKKERYVDLLLDAFVSSALLWLMQGTLTGIGIAIVGASIFSILTYFNNSLAKNLL